MTVRILTGDNRQVLRTLPDQSVQCCVTSPPYYGLRAYLPDGHPDGASEIGKEDKPEEYVARMVAVFREVRRVLRDDGCCWVNLGSSYASGGSAANQSRQRARAPSCDIDGKELANYQAIDCAYPGHDDERLGAIGSHRDGKDCIDQHLSPNVPPPSRTTRDNEHRDSEVAPARRDVSDALASTILSSTGNGLDVSAPSREVLACPKATKTSLLCVQEDAHMSGHKHGTTSRSETSAFHTVGMVSSDSACRCGSCGICWANIAIPLLNLKQKDLLSIPTLVALALQADGWYLRSEVIWHKPNPMPESVTDRPTKAHEQVFLLSKGARYFYDAGAIAEEATYADYPGASVPQGGFNGTRATKVGNTQASFRSIKDTRNARSVWTIATQPFSGSHFATMPPELAERCIKAGTRPGDTVLDPFGGAGTTGLVADRLQRHAILTELNPEYAAMARARIQGDGGMFCDVA